MDKRLERLKKINSEVDELLLKEREITKELKEELRQKRESSFKNMLSDLNEFSEMMKSASGRDGNIRRINITTKSNIKIYIMNYGFAIFHNTKDGYDHETRFDGYETFKDFASNNEYSRLTKDAIPLVESLTKNWRTEYEYIKEEFAKEYEKAIVEKCKKSKEKQKKLINELKEY